jgi:type IV secretory pathway VirB2 component (pilin)
MKKTPSVLVSCLVVLAITPAAHAGYSPGDEPLIGFGTKILDFLTGPLAYVVVGIGLAIAAISLVMGSRDGLSRAFLAIGGGALLFGIHAVINFVQAAAR